MLGSVYVACSPTPTTPILQDQPTTTFHIHFGVNMSLSQRRGDDDTTSYVSCCEASDATWDGHVLALLRDDEAGQRARGGPIGLWCQDFARRTGLVRQMFLNLERLPLGSHTHMP